MKTHPLTIRLDAALVERAEAAASATGLSVEDYLVEVIAAALRVRGVADDVAPFEALDVRTEAAKRFQREQAEIALAEYRRTGESIPLEEALAQFDRALDTALSGRR